MAVTADSRAVLLSDNRLFRDGVGHALQKRHIDVVGEGCSVSELLQDIRTASDPDLAILHLASGQCSDGPLATLRDLRAHFSRAKLVVLADLCARPILPVLLGTDISAILFTQISSDMLERSLELVLSGHRLFPADILALRQGEAGGEPSRPSTPQSPAVALAATVSQYSSPLRLDGAYAPTLSRREHQVAQCLATGLSNKAIARRLCITEGTVKVYVKALLRKLRATNRTQLAIWALHQSGSPAQPT